MLLSRTSTCIGLAPAALQTQLGVTETRGHPAHTRRAGSRRSGDPRCRLSAPCRGRPAHGPPEDVGGPWGYDEFLEAIADAQHERHKELLEWCGGDFDRSSSISTKSIAA